MITRDQAVTLLEKYLSEEENLKKSYAAEAILRKLSQILNKDVKLWSLTGLLHNIDYEYTKGNPEERGILSGQLLSNLLPKEGVNAIKADNYVHTDYVPVTSLDKVMIATITFLGLFFYIKRHYPDKEITDISLPFYYSKYQDKNFAQIYNRHRIEIITNIGISVKDFIKLALDSIYEIEEKLKN